MQPIVNRILSFVQACDAVTALILIGSQARQDHPADAFSDTDLILIVNDTGRFIHTDAWLREIGEAHISFTEPTIDGQQERRVLFDGAQDVDFVIMEEAAALRALESGEAANILGRGYRVLVAKRGFAVPTAAIAPVSSFTPATEAQFISTVNDFWYHSVWAAKKLLRRELWTAKFCVDGYMKHKLLWMVEQHEHAVRRSGADTWYAGRFMERWAQPDVFAAIQHTFAHFEQADIAAALLETMALFRRLAAAVADAAGFAYPEHADHYATAWVREQLAPVVPAAAKDGDMP